MSAAGEGGAVLAVLAAMRSRLTRELCAGEGASPWLAAEYYRDIGAAPGERQVWRDVQSPGQISPADARAHFVVASRLTSFARGWGRSDKVAVHYDDMAAVRAAAAHLRAGTAWMDVEWVSENCCNRVRALFDEGPSPLVQLWVMAGDLGAEGGGMGVSVFKLHVRRPPSPITSSPCVWHLPMGRLMAQQ